MKSIKMKLAAAALATLGACGDATNNAAQGFVRDVSNAAANSATNAISSAANDAINQAFGGGATITNSGRGTLSNCFTRYRRYENRTYCPDANGNSKLVRTTVDRQRSLETYRRLNGWQ